MNKLKNITPEMSIVVPVYNEEQNLPTFISRTVSTVEKIVSHYEIIFALDPCTDDSEGIIERASLENPSIKALVFSRRFGQPAATLAGIKHCTGEVCVIIDADLQDQPELIQDLYIESKKGFDVVLAQRKSRQGETILKRLVSYIGYGLINKLSEVEIPRNTGDFRLIKRRVVDELNKLGESHGFLRGLVGYIGFDTSYVLYDRDARHLGSGHYNRFFGSLKIGMNGLVGFSRRPLQLMSVAGFAFAILSFLLTVAYLIMFLIGKDFPIGFPTTIIVVTFFAGVQLLALGLIGEYIGRIYDEVKGRPLFITKRKINFP